MRTDYKTLLAQSIAAARQDIPLTVSRPVVYGGRPMLGTEQRTQFRAEVDVGGILNALERFGIIDQPPEKMRELAKEWHKTYLSSDPEQANTFLRDPVSQAMMRKFRDVGYPVMQTEDGYLTFPKPVEWRLDPGMVAGARMFGTQPTIHGAVTGAYGEQARQRMLQALPGGTVRSPDILDVIPPRAGQRLGEVYLHRQQAEVEKAKAQAAKEKAHAGYFQAQTEYLGKTPPEIPETPQDKLTQQAVKSIYDNIKKARDLLKFDPRQTPVERAQAMLQFGSTVAGSIHALRALNLNPQDPNVTAATNEVLSVASVLSGMPENQYKVVGYLGSERYVPEWQPVFKRAADLLANLAVGLGPDRPQYITEQIVRNVMGLVERTVPDRKMRRHYIDALSEAVKINMPEEDLDEFVQLGIRKGYIRPRR